ncbi:MAG: 6-phosphogluconolactonase [Nitrospiraceae bacterium]|nr:MAG: 6-phosphogluconolactonase [Nitrospiraceae bacterium]
MNRAILIFRSKEGLVDAALRRWLNAARDALKSREFFSAALSGGNTPAPLYARLAVERDFPWHNTHIFQVDERFVPYDHDENNYHFINTSLLRHVPISPKNIHPILTFEPSPQASADRYEQDLTSFCKSFRMRVPRIDLVILGIGEDGHTASLFPDTPALSEKQRFAVAVTPADPSKKERITLTLPVLNNAVHVLVMALGKNKAGAVREVVENDQSTLPASLVKPEKGSLTFLLDEDAGSLLSDKKRFISR